MLLTEPERRLLWRLSVFVGGCTLEAAEHVCAGEGLPAGRVLDLLTSLGDKSLVLFDKRETETRGYGERYRLLETLRQYAAERLEADGEAVRLRSRHRDYFLSVVEEAEPRLAGAEQEVLLAKLEAERPNLRAALSWCGAETDGAEAGLRLAGALGHFWEIRSYYSEGRASLSEALRRAGAGGRTHGRAKALNAAGMLAFYQGDYGAARPLHEEGLAIFRELGNRQGAARSLNELGKIALEQGRSAPARALYAEGISLQRELGDQRGAAIGLRGLAAGLAARGNVPKAACLWGVAEALCEAAGEPLPLGETETINRRVAQARAVLGEVACATAWQEDRALTWEQAAAYALEDISAPKG